MFFSPFNFCQSLGRGVASHCSDLHFFGCYWSWSSFYTYVVSITRASPAVIGLTLNWGRWKCSRCICALPHPSSAARQWWLQSWLMPLYQSILGCSPSRVSRGWGVLVLRGVAMVGMGRSSCPVDDHLLLFSSLSDTTQMNNAVPTSPLLQQMGHPHSYPSLGQISNPYEQQPPGKELNKYASLKAVGKHNFFLLFCTFLFLLHFLISNFFLLHFLFSWSLSSVYYPSFFYYPSSIHLPCIYPSIISFSFFFISLCLILSL